ncbi:hypothetical protein K8374_06590 [Pseudomonas sp. p1(2021b)]|uniref:hypothetical protein n=1 Tax=Pseudomonas sp. p1(2021b) TaxID=2874628 RepID=UPI001CCF89B3|nr:hypothetical protein [Pseudomonas sp. p1(2021b)]UBM26637.1 hypothetical protein K8374_06590 [Pseudomonas sp. p1(2021b)]
MAGYSEDELVSWMKEKSRMFDWGMIAVMDRAKTNRLLVQEYIRHFEEDAYLPPQSGEINTDGRWLNRIENAILDIPRLSFENANLQNSKARLRMAMVGGNRVRLEKRGSAIEVRRIDQYGPQQRPELEMDLYLPDVPGSVDEGGSIFLDLKDCKDFLFTFAGSSDEQRDMGEFFKQKFHELEAAKRIYHLGRIERGLADLMRPDRFFLRTQPRDELVRDGDGAVVTFIRLEGDDSGSIPTSNDTFKYMIPNDAGKDYSAAVAIGSERLAISQMVLALQAIIPEAAFKTEYKQENGRRVFTGATLTNGTLAVQEQEFTIDGFEQFEDLVASYRLDECICDISDRLQVKMDASGKKIELKCTLQGVAEGQLLSLASESGQFEELVRAFKIDLSHLFEVRRDPYQYEVTASYDFSSEEGGQLKNTSFDFKVIQEADLRGDTSRTMSNAGQRTRSLWDQLMEAIARLIIKITEGIRLSLSGTVEQIGGKQSFRGVLEESFKKSFSLSSPLKALIKETVKLNFGNAIINDQHHLPLDAVTFGKVNPELTHFVIDDLEPVMAAGATRQFKTIPAMDGLQWQVEPKEGVGSIDPVTGLYTAPEVGSFDDVFVRGRVIAKGKDFESSALLTVVRSNLMLNPLVVTTWLDSEVELQAGALGAVGNLEWCIENADPHGSFKTPGASTANMTYVTNAQGEKPSKAFYIDEVSVRDTDTGEKRTMLIIIKDDYGPPLTVSTTLDADSHSLTLKAIEFDEDVTEETDWVIRQGPGKLEDNRYIADETSREPFAVITAAYIGGRRTYEGFVIVPLPLSRQGL